MKNNFNSPKPFRYWVASTVDAQDFNIAAKHAIAVEANTGKFSMRKMQPSS